MDSQTLITRITRLEDEVELLRKERDRFKRLASNAEEETAKRGVEYLTLEGEYEEERRKRMNAEKQLDMRTGPTHVSDRQDIAIPVKVDTIRTEHSSSKPRAPKDSQGVQDIKKIDPKEIICVDSDDDSIKSFKTGTPVRASKRIPVKPKSKEIIPLTASSSSISTPKIEKKRPIDEVSSTESLQEPIKKVPKTHTESKLVRDTPTVNSIPKNESQGKRKAKAESASGFALSASEVSKYMKGTSAYIINPPPKPPLVSRTCLTETYGLPGMGLLWTSKDKRYRFLLPTYGVNPEMPRFPGGPGLLLSCRNEMCDGLPWTLFIPVVEEKKARWIYAGEYIGETVGLLSSEDFRNQDQKVKVTWGKKIEKHKKYPVYCALRARMTLRLGGSSDPTEREVEKEVVRIKRKDYTSNLTAQDVIAAFERGDEHISIVKLRCVNYKHERETELANAQVRSNTREKEKCLSKKNEGVTGRKKTVRKQGSMQQRGRRVIRQESESSAHSKYSESVSSDDDSDYT